MLEVKGVIKRFGGVTAVSGCTLSVAEHSITGLIGPNGAGKSTLFHLISGFMRPDAGEIWFRGHRIDGLPAHEVARRGLARTFQIPRELGQMTVLENLMLVPAGQSGESMLRALAGFRRVAREEQAIRDRALRLLETVQLSHLAAEPAANLSVGQKKLLELARAIMARPALVLLDEPGAGVNPTLLRDLMGVIARMRDEGHTFLIIEHNMDLVMNLCDHVIVMSQGQRLTEGPPDAVRRDPVVQEAYLGGETA